MSDTAGPFSDPAGAGDTGTVDRLLLEAGLDDDAGLRPVLHELRSLAAGQPAPSGSVAALMVSAPAMAGDLAGDPGALAAQTTGSAAGPPTDELAARRRAKRRITLTTLSVAVSLAAGGTVAVASDQGVRDAFGQLNQAVTSFVAGTAGTPADKPGQRPLTDPAQRGGGLSEPVPNAPAAPDAQRATAPEPDAANGREGVHLPSPSDVPPSGITVPENLVPGTGGLPVDGPLDSGAPGLPGQPPVLPVPQPRASSGAGQ